MNPLPKHLVLYDGICGLCDRTVQFLLEHDKEHQLFFAPLQGPTAESIIKRNEWLRDVDSIIYVETDQDNEQIWTRSNAVFQVMKYLQAPWSMVSILRFIPKVITDAGYDLVAKNRYHIFGRLHQCRIPQPHEKERFLP